MANPDLPISVGPNPSPTPSTNPSRPPSAGVSSSSPFTASMPSSWAPSPPGLPFRKDRQYYVAHSPHDFTRYKMHDRKPHLGEDGYIRSYPRDDDGQFHCVAFVRGVAGLPHSSAWRAGELVRGNTNIPFGAAIATFDDKGSYSGHVAIYLGQDEKGIWVADQWKEVGYAAVRQIKFPKLLANPRVSNNGDLYRVIDPVLTSTAAKGNQHSPRVSPGPN